MKGANTLFLRLEGPLQAWGDTSKFVIRRTMEAPTKSGVLGLVCCAMGVSRPEARETLRKLNRLVMGVRIDRPGTRWWDFQTVGAGVGMTTAAGGIKTWAQGALITRREYLADASFLVALQGEPDLIACVYDALASPRWSIFLGRRSCPPSMPVLARPRRGESWENPASHETLDAALVSVPWSARFKGDSEPDTAETLVEWRAASETDVAPDEAEVWYDVPLSFDPPAHEPRLVLRRTVSVTAGEPLQWPTDAPPSTNAKYRERREDRIAADGGLCVFCKSPGPRMTVQHVTYRRAGGNETLEDLRSLCGLCHDAVTMLEYGLNMGLDRIDPCDPCWRDRILEKRNQIIRFRSLATRRRALAAEEV